MNIIKKFISGVLALSSCCIIGVNNISATSIDINEYWQGDIDNDGIVDIVDLAYLRNFLSGVKESSNDRTTQRMDLNRDGVISTEDLSIISKILLGDLQTSVRSYSSTPTDITSSAIKNYRIFNANTGGTISNYSLNKLSAVPDNLSSTFSLTSDNAVSFTNNSNSPIVKVSSSLGNYSGFIVDNHTILTAAHCVYDTINNIPASNIIYSIYEDNWCELLSSQNANYYHVPVDYINAPAVNIENDYAIIRVSEDLQDYGVFELGIAGKIFNNFPYRCIYVCGRSDYNNAPFCSPGCLTGSKITDYMMQYEQDSLAWSEGGPILYNVSGVRTAIGIHSDKSLRKGKRIDTNILHFVYNNNNF